MSTFANDFSHEWRVCPFGVQILANESLANASKHSSTSLILAPIPTPEPKPTPPQLPESNDNDEDNTVEQALNATLIEKSLSYVYGMTDDFVSWDMAQEIGFEMAREKAFSVATRPEDSPWSWKEAMTRDDRDKWLSAAQAEVDALRANGTWELVPLPDGQKPVSSRWVFLIKRKSDGTIDCYKARLVAKGFSQRPGVDFD